MRIYPVVASLAVVLFMTGCSPKDPNDPGYVVASGKGVTIYRKDLDAERNFQMKIHFFQGEPTPIQKAQMDHHYLEQMIIVDVLKNAAGTPAPEVLDRAKKAFTDLKSQASFNEQVKKLGIDESKVQESLQDKEIITAFLDKQLELNTKEAQASQEEAKAFYDANPSQFQVPELAQARYIMVQIPNGANAKEVAEKRKVIEKARQQILSKKEKFEDVAKAISEEKTSAANGGLLPQLPRTAVKGSPVFEKALFEQPLNEVGPIFVTTNATTQFHFLQVVERTPARKLTFEEVSTNIVKELSQDKKKDFFNKLIADIRSKAEIKIFLPPIPSIEHIPMSMPPLPSRATNMPTPPAPAAGSHP